MFPFLHMHMVLSVPTESRRALRNVVLVGLATSVTAQVVAPSPPTPGVDDEDGTLGGLEIWEVALMTGTGALGLLLTLVAVYLFFFSDRSEKELVPATSTTVKRTTEAPRQPPPRPSTEAPTNKPTAKPTAHRVGQLVARSDPLSMKGFHTVTLYCSDNKHMILKRVPGAWIARKRLPSSQQCEGKTWTRIGGRFYDSNVLGPTTVNAWVNDNEKLDRSAAKKGEPKLKVSVPLVPSSLKSGV